MTDTKRCSTCRKDRPLSEFDKDKSKRDGLKTQCKICRKERWRRGHHGKYRKEKYYDLQRGEWDRRIQEQENRCPACFRTFSPDRIAVPDHCHECRETRHLLCRQCNSAAGLCSDSPTTLLRLARMVREHRKSCKKPRYDRKGLWNVRPIRRDK